MESGHKDGEDCSTKSNPSERNDGEEETQDGSKSRNGESSSSSTVEENVKSKTGGPTSVRPYVRSKMQRLRWTPDLHQRFIQSVERLGGQERATPKLVLQMMCVKGLSIAHVKSHLQMYRSKKIDDPNQGGHSNIYNFSPQQLSMMQGFNQRSLPNFRSYEDHVSWRVHPHQENWMHRPYMSREGLCGTFADTIFGNNININSTNQNAHIIASSSNNENSKWRIGHPPKLEFKALHQSLTSSSSIQLLPNQIIEPSKQQSGTLDGNKDLYSDITVLQEFMKKRKEPSTTNCDLDLNLSLKVARVNENADKAVESNLCLSLYSPGPSSSKQAIGKMKEREGSNNKHESTLDLTL